MESTCGSSSGRNFQEEQQQRLIHQYRTTGRLVELDDAVPSLRSLLQRAYTHPATAPLSSRPAQNPDSFLSRFPSTISLPVTVTDSLAVEPLSLMQMLDRALILTEPMTGTESTRSILSVEEDEDNEGGPARSPSQARRAAGFYPGNHRTGDSRRSSQ